VAATPLRVVYAPTTPVVPPSLCVCLTTHAMPCASRSVYPEDGQEYARLLRQGNAGTVERIAKKIALLAAAEKKSRQAGGRPTRATDAGTLLSLLSYCRIFPRARLLLIVPIYICLPWPVWHRVAVAAGSGLDRGARRGVGARSRHVRPPGRRRDAAHAGREGRRPGEYKTGAFLSLVHARGCFAHLAPDVLLVLRVGVVAQAAPSLEAQKQALAASYSAPDVRTLASAAVRAPVVDPSTVGAVAPGAETEKTHTASGSQLERRFVKAAAAVSQSTSALPPATAAVDEAAKGTQTPGATASSGQPPSPGPGPTPAAATGTATTTTVTAASAVAVVTPLMACEASAAAVKAAAAQLSALATPTPTPTAVPTASPADAPATGADNGVSPASAVDAANASDDEFTPATCRRAAAVAATASAAFAQVSVPTPPLTTHRQHPFSQSLPSGACPLPSSSSLSRAAGEVGGQRQPGGVGAPRGLGHLRRPGRRHGHVSRPPSRRIHYFISYHIALCCACVTAFAQAAP
jgi:hypothetical protein